jgi:hypothetical protein
MAIRVEAGSRDMSGPEIARTAGVAIRSATYHMEKVGSIVTTSELWEEKGQALIAGAQGICPIPVLFDARHQWFVSTA